MKSQGFLWGSTGWVAALLVGALGACGGPKAPPPAEPKSPLAGAKDGTTVEKGPLPAPSAEPRLSGTGDPPEEARPAPPPPDPEIPSALPRVTVKNIGMHIGGGPNDAATKAPFANAIEKHFDDFRRCYGKVEKPGAKGTFGIDLLVPKEGDHATTSNSKTALPGPAFRDCVAHVFETVEFSPPRRGATKLSYALSFEPEP